MKWIIVAAFMISGCLSTNTVQCGDGAECPVGNVCTRGGGCATQGDVAACNGLVEGDTCSSATGGAGICNGGACRTGLCGNVVIDSGELCDDGNSVSGDGCRADCGKVELCGDGLLDDGEGCDDGNSNTADGCDACVPTAWRAHVVIGGGLDALSVWLNTPQGLAADGLGNLYVADTYDQRIRRVSSTGVITTVAGTGSPGFSGDGGDAVYAQIANPMGLAVDGFGSVYFADSLNQRIRRVDAAGVMTTVAGTTAAGNFGGGYNGDSIPATLAQLNMPLDVAVDGLGNLYIADRFNHRIRRVSPSGIITTFAGSTSGSGFSGDGGPATLALLNQPAGVALDGLGNVYINDARNLRIRRVDASGTITTVAGTGIFPAPLYDSAGVLAVNAAINPISIAVDATGIMYFGDSGWLRRVGADGLIRTVAGTGIPGDSGDGGLATNTQILGPRSIVLAGLGKLFFTDDHRIRRVDPAGIISSVAGSGAGGPSGEGGAATAAPLSGPSAIALDGAGNVYIANSSAHRVVRVTPGGLVETAAGTGALGTAGDGGMARLAQLESPIGVAVDGSGNLYITTGVIARVRRVRSDGIIVAAAGTGTAGFSGDGGAATSAQLSGPQGLAVDGAGNLYIADMNNNRIRRVTPAGVISTVAGSGTQGFSGDGGAATSAQLSAPSGVACDGVGNLYIADKSNQRIRRVSPAGVITTIAGTGVLGSSGDGGAATAAKLSYPESIAIDALGNLYLADRTSLRVRKVATTGIITTIAGGGIVGVGGDGGPVANARLSSPVAVAVDALGRVLFADQNGQLGDKLRRIANGTITTVVGVLDPEGTGPVAQAHLADPRAFVVAPSFTLFAGGSSGTLEALRATPPWLEVVAGRYPQDIVTGALARFRDKNFGAISGVAYDPSAGLIYLSESTANRLHVVTVVDPTDAQTWTIGPLANPSGTEGFADGVAVSAQFRGPTGLYLDEVAHHLYVADTGNHVVRRIDLANGVANATVTTIAGRPATRGYLGDGGPSGQASLYAPQAITRCQNGDLFIADTGNHRVRRVAMSSGVITTVLGVGVAASSGDGRPATNFPVQAPLGLACDAVGNLYVTSTSTVRLLPADASGVVDGSGGVQTIYGAAPRDTFPASVMSCLTGLVVTGATTVQVVDACTGLLVELERVPGS